MRVPVKFKKHTLPSKELVFRAMELSSPRDTKVVILGQDPYPNREDACGLAFSVPKGRKIPASLQNIFKELIADLSLPKPAHGDLTPWAKQGVLLLNRILTVEEGESLSHEACGWEELTDAFLEKLALRRKPLVIIAWGKKAQESLEGLPIHRGILILTGGHPSPLNRTGDFLGGRYFSKTNEWLVSHGEQPIDWSLT